MADETLLQILREGGDKWTAWRFENRRCVSPDFSGADLSGVNLRDANLFNARLRGANLTGANLSHADLFRAGLEEANLFEVDLAGADLSSADLTNANLSKSRIMSALFSNAILSGTQFEAAIAGGTVFSELDLQEAKGLETITHIRASDIGISTIYMSKGNIPEIFLRCCGVPESFIVQIPALVAATQPIQFYSCFISYSSKDEELAQRLYADLQSSGVRCWFAPEDLKIGERFRRRIDEVIRVYDRLLLILSENSVASSWVEKEVETAMESEDEQHRTILFPVRLDDTMMEIKTGWPADVRRTRHIGDFRRWKEHDEYRKAFARLLADLKASA